MKMYEKKLDYEKLYGLNINKNFLDLSANIDKHLNNLDSNNPIVLRESIISINQLFFNGLIDSNPNVNSEEISKTIDALVEAGKTSMNSFYLGDGIDSESIKERIMPYERIIRKQSSKNNSTSRHLNTFSGISENAKFANYIEQISYRFDNLKTIIPIISGGLESAFLVGNIFDDAIITPIRYSPIKKNDRTVKIPKHENSYQYLHSADYGNVLILDDWLSSGNTLIKTAKELNNYYVNDKLYFAVVHCGKLKTGLKNLELNSIDFDMKDYMLFGKINNS